VAADAVAYIPGAGGGSIYVGHAKVQIPVALPICLTACGFDDIVV